MLGFASISRQCPKFHFRGYDIVGISILQMQVGTKMLVAQPGPVCVILRHCYYGDFLSLLMVLVRLSIGSKNRIVQKSANQVGGNAGLPSRMAPHLEILPASFGFPRKVTATMSKRMLSSAMCLVARTPVLIKIYLCSILEFALHCTWNSFVVTIL